MSAGTGYSDEETGKTPASVGLKVLWKGVAGWACHEDNVVSG